MNKKDIIRACQVIDRANRLIYRELAGSVGSKEAPPLRSEKKINFKFVMDRGKKPNKLACLNNNCKHNLDGEYCNFKGDLATCSERIEG